MKRILQKLALLPTPLSIIILLLSGLVFTATVWAVHLWMMLRAEAGLGFDSPLYYKQIYSQVTYFPISTPNTFQFPKEADEPHNPITSINGRPATEEDIQRLKEYDDKLQAEKSAKENEPAEIEKRVLSVVRQTRGSVIGELYRAGCYDKDDVFHPVDFNLGEWSLPTECDPKKVFSYYVRPDWSSEFLLMALAGLIMTGIFASGSTLLVSASLGRVRNRNVITKPDLIS